MKLHRFAPWNLVAIISVLLALALVLACGTSAPEAQPEAAQPEAAQPEAAKPAAPEPTAIKELPAPQVQREAPKAAPTAVAQAAAEPVMAMKPEGTLNVGLKEMGPFFIHPAVMTNPQIFVQGTAPIG